MCKLCMKTQRTQDVKNHWHMLASSSHSCCVHCCWRKTNQKEEEFREYSQCSGVVHMLNIERILFFLTCGSI